MTEERKTQEEPRQPMGVLACLAAGFEIVARRPAMMMVPLLLDLFLWLGPRLSLSPIFVALNQLYKTLPSAEGNLVLLDEQMKVQLAQMFNVGATRYDLFAALSPAPLLGTPAVMATQLVVERPMGIRPEIVVSSPFVVLGLVVLLVVVGLGINTLYLRMVGRQVISETESALPGPPQSVLTLWGRFIVFTLIVLFVLGSLLLAGSSFAMFVGLLIPNLAYFALTFLFALLMFVVFHLIFAIPGMVQLRRSPLHAIQESILLTRVDFVGISVLVLLILVISKGFNVVWTLPDPATWSNVIGIAGHAFVSTALVATLFVYYQERLGFLPKVQNARAPQEIPAHSLMSD